MQWNIDFQLSAVVVLLAVVYFQISGRHIPIKRNRIFLLTTYVEILTIVSSLIVRGFFEYRGMDSAEQIRFVIRIYYAFQYFVPILIMTYLVIWAGRSVRENGIALVMYFLPIVVYVEEIVRNFATDHLYYFNKQYGYLDSSNVDILNGVAIYCLLYGLIYCVIRDKFNSFAKLTTVAVLGIVTAGAVILQGQIPSVVFVDFVVAIVLLIIYFVVQNPSEMLDNTTQVLNRNMLDELLRTDIVTGHRFDLVVLALDDFKFVNKTFGVKVGDMMLLQVAHFLSALTKKGLVYRYGSDQFALQISPGDSDVCEIVEQIRERFRHPWITDSVSVMMTTAIACISCPDDGNELEAIVDAIDYSILSAKKSGKGRVVFARDMDLFALRKEKAIELALEKAIEQDTIQVYYQPIYNTEKQKYTSAEALVRIYDDLLGNIPPDVFIPIAEKNGSIVKMGTMIFEKVCKFISEHNLKDTSIEYIEVNVSVVQCMQQDFVETLNDIMDYYHVLPEQINLEVTETAAVNSISVLQENIEKLYHQGISFSLDDYGSGYATIGYIHRLPFQIIKLDKLMVWDAFENERAGITLKHTVGMLKELNLHIVAEGVETKEQQMRLASIGCDYLQGWYYSKAISQEEFADLIAEAC